MITIYRPDETDFSRNGLGAIDKNVIDPLVSETLNGMYMFTFRYPIFAPKGPYMKGESILKAPTPKGTQLFRIHKEEPSMGYTDITAYHIFYDLAFNWIDDTNIVGKNGTAAGAQILGATNYLHSFEFVSDISVIENARIVAMNGVQAFLDDSKDNTFISRWGGEIDRNNFQIRMLREVGEDRHVTIEYRKDLLKYTSSVDWSTVVTRLKPVGFNGLELPEIFIDSPLIANYPYPKVGRIEYKEVKAAIGEYADDEDAIPLEDAYAELRRLAGLEFSQAELDRPTATYTVVFAPLMETKEYKKYAALQRIYIGDTVKVKHTEEGIDLTAKVISYEYNPMTKAYTEITLGSVQQTLSGTTYKNLQSQIDDIKQVELSNLEQSIDRATGLINTAMGGNVIKRNGELLIMDTDDVTTATQVWRWNLNGLGYSGTGYAGPYRTAITIDGHFVADFIDTGTLTADLITTGTVTGLNMDMNLDSGILTFTDPISGNDLILDQGEMYFQNGTNTRHLKYSEEGLILEPGTGNTGTAGNTGLIMVGGDGAHKYIDFRNTDLETTQRLVGINETIRLHTNERVEIRKNAAFNGTDAYNGIRAVGYFIGDGAEGIWDGGDGVAIVEGYNMIDFRIRGVGVMQIYENGIECWGEMYMNGHTIWDESDLTLKTNVLPTTVDAIAETKKQKVIEFEWDKTNPHNEGKPEGKQLGLSAQDSGILQISAEETGKGYMGVNLIKEIHLATLTNQKLIADLENTKKELADLKSLLISKGVI